MGGYVPATIMGLFLSLLVSNQRFVSIIAGNKSHLQECTYYKQGKICRSSGKKSCTRNCHLLSD